MAPTRTLDQENYAMTAEEEQMLKAYLGLDGADFEDWYRERSISVAAGTIGVSYVTMGPSGTEGARASTGMPYNSSSAHPFQPPQEDRHDQQADPADDGRRETGDVSRLPPRDDMQNSLHLHQAAHQATLRRHFGSDDSTIVLSEIPVRWSPGQTEGHRIPDLLIAFDVDFNLAVEQMGYSIRDQGKPPDFVLGIASPSTGRQDYTGKRNDYAAFGIPEYWRFDPSGGRHHDAPLAGDLLVEGTYQPIEVRETGPGTSTGTATRWAWTSAGKTAG